METEYKTLRAWNVKPGDVVDSQDYATPVTILRPYDGAVWSHEKDCAWWADDGGIVVGTDFVRIISRAPRDETPKLWRDMTDAEKGALLLAHHRGKVIEVVRYFGEEAEFWYQVSDPTWHIDERYRIRPDPKVEMVTLYGGSTKGNNRHWGYSIQHIGPETHRITFNLIDGKPDPASIKMEEL
jgi:hypothetical protein